MDAKEAREIVKGVEDDEGKSRLDNLVREVRYQFAKGYLAALDGKEVRGLVTSLESAIELLGEEFQVDTSSYEMALKKFRATAGGAK